MERKQANVVMTIRFSCPKCQAKLSAIEEKAGVKFPCPKCGQRLQVPTPPSTSQTMLGELDGLTNEAIVRALQSVPSPTLGGQISEPLPQVLPVSETLPEATVSPDSAIPWCLPADPSPVPLTAGVRQYMLVLRIVFVICLAVLPFLFTYLMDNDGKMIINPIWLAITAGTAILIGWLLWPSESMARWRNANSAEAHALNLTLGTLLGVAASIFAPFLVSLALCLLICPGLLVLPVILGGASSGLRGPTWVSGYLRRDGTYVRGHIRRR